MDSPLPPELSLSELNQTSVDSWNTNAKYWDSYMGSDGNDFYQILELPALERLVDLQAGEHVLDLATGNGLVARRMAELGGMVTATDVNAAMLDCARERTTAEEAKSVIYRLLDVTKQEELEEFVGRAKEHDGFNAITVNMGIMDIPTLESLAAALPHLLHENGRFVATILHPAFMNSGCSRNISLAENKDTGQLETKHSIGVERYLTIPPARSKALQGQPVPQVFFHRPLQELFRPFFRHGLVLDGLEEPSFTGGYDEEKIQSYYNFPQIPPIMAFRLRKTK